MGDSVLAPQKAMAPLLTSINATNNAFLRSRKEGVTPENLVFTLFGASKSHHFEEKLFLESGQIVAPEKALLTLLMEAALVVWCSGALVVWCAL